MQSPFPISAAPQSTSDDEQRLVAEVLARERKATAEFVARCADWLYAFIRHRLAPRTEMVEDLMQESLLAAWQGLPNYRGDASLRSWVLGIARHKVEDYYRSRIRQADAGGVDMDELKSNDVEDVLPEPAMTPMFEQQLDSAIKQEKIQTILASLPEAYSLALLWRYRDGKSAREMAQLTGKTEKAIERLLARARENFRRRWNDARI